ASSSTSLPTTLTVHAFIAQMRDFHIGTSQSVNAPTIDNSSTSATLVTVAEETPTGVTTRSQARESPRSTRGRPGTPHPSANKDNNDTAPRDSKRHKATTTDNMID
ncbi:hypothetical protein JCM5353_004858, partial [Sporobolomyces roseus]